MTRQEYIAHWNVLLTNYVSTTLGIIAGRLCQLGIEVEWKERLECLKLLLEGKDVRDVKADLTQGIVKDETLDKTEKIYAEIDGFLIEISVKEDAEKECLKEIARQYEHYRREITKMELNVLE